MEPKKRAPFHRSLGYAWLGVISHMQKERNLRIHFALLQCLTAFDVVIQPPLGETALGVVAAGTVIGMELVNSAVEASIDLIAGDQRHPLAKEAKDAAAGAVLVVSAAALMVALYLALANWPWHVNVLVHVRWKSMTLMGGFDLAAWIAWWRASVFGRTQNSHSA
ncbi:MAG: diacylglycerol kinase [Alicyclobacillaceae bacterium]|uniref:diacylglycerol kinase n=1 Tax=Alicyclobacillus sp. SP_1 TaxID=2942475 RepID=UPI00215893AC|nr:diacylglycerol kinase [Alicyclobacillus sp. SP_1]MCY0888473.1 diacylglycerol kinase [Alicyclobacillaceae bacterium]MCY0895185.1 diacylglycerol kinase [Alicyclobacillaceae bacterium]